MSVNFISSNSSNHLHLILNDSSRPSFQPDFKTGVPSIYLLTMALLMLIHHRLSWYSKRWRIKPNTPEVSFNVLWVFFYHLLNAELADYLTKTVLIAYPISYRQWSLGDRSTSWHHIDPCQYSLSFLPHSKVKTSILLAALPIAQRHESALWRWSAWFRESDWVVCKWQPYADCTLGQFFV